MTKVVSRSPTTGEVIRELDMTLINDLPDIFKRAHVAQIQWGISSVSSRAKFLLQLRETILNHVEGIIELLSLENGKPRYEAMVNEIQPTVDLLTYYSKNAPKLLRDQTLSLSLLKHRKSYLNYWPLGTVAVISPWNYPFFLPFSDILMALVTGNSVIFKPSEVTPCIGLKIQEICYEAGLPPNVLQTIIGDAEVGEAIIQNKPGKIFFTGSASTGKKIMAAASEHLIPLNLELGGKDAMIVLPDANIDFASSAALWGGFSNSGQVCASVERILVHERIATPFLNSLKEKIGKLRQGSHHQSPNLQETISDRKDLDPQYSPQYLEGYSYELGAITFEKQKAVYTKQIADARSKNAEFITGGEFSSDGRFLKPTIIAGPQVEETDVYKEESFGPIVTVTTFKSISEAVQKANQSKYGLAASIITQNISLGEEIAKQLAVGTVTINEVTYTAGISETPWGGVKESGFGRTHSEAGLYEFVNVRHIHKPKFGFFTFKSLWWFPYTPFQFTTFRLLLELYRRNWISKLRALPHFLWNFAQLIKTEKRL